LIVRLVSDTRLTAQLCWALDLTGAVRAKT